MINDQNDLSVNLIVDKMKSLTEGIYGAIKELPCDQFGTIMSMLMTMWCDRNEIDIFQFLEVLITAISDENDDTHAFSST